MNHPTKHRRGGGARERAGARQANQLRIIAGRWRGVRVRFPSLPQLRPSPDRVRETLFNWLQPVIAGARCLDLFAGSGALGLEALSRGAGQTVFVEHEPRIGRHLRETLQRLQAQEVGSVHVADALRFLQGPATPFDVVFLDPPYASTLLPEALTQLARGGWLADGAFVYAECPADAGLPDLPSNWSIHRSKRAGQVGYHLLRATSRSPAHD